MLKGIELCKSYKKQGRVHMVLDHCTLELGQGQALGLMGPSGCGKSTLARILLRLIEADRGQITFQNNNITTLGQSYLKDFRRQVQFISQRPESFFDPLVKLGKSLVEPSKLYQCQWQQEEINQLLEQVKLSRAVLDRYPHQVSGGEIQRLSIARALLLKPKVLVLDEPTSMLDISVQAQILHLLKAIRLQENLSYLYIGHDRAVLKFICDQILVMDEGRIK